jgi:2,4-diketo-3-deoxy-L-fuconate hydrolase
MKYVSFDTGSGSYRAGFEIEGFIADLALAADAVGGYDLPCTALELLLGGEVLMKRVDTVVKKTSILARRVNAGKSVQPDWLHQQGRIHLGPPLPNPEKVICIGQNYREHVDEQKKKGKKAPEPPANPIFFCKFASSLTGPLDPIRFPPKKISTQIDFEAELALVIGKTAYQVSHKGALDHVAGYMVFNDVSSRDAQMSDKQWSRGKSFDTYGPCGPWLVTPDELGDPDRLEIQCILNGKVMQDGTTRDMIFNCRKLISFLSQGMTLHPGDIISTGTPSGVGYFRNPKVLLKDGDIVECRIEKIGSIVNQCRAS